MANKFDRVIKTVTEGKQDLNRWYNKNRNRLDELLKYEDLKGLDREALVVDMLSDVIDVWEEAAKNGDYGKKQ